MSSRDARPVAEKEVGNSKLSAHTNATSPSSTSDAKGTNSARDTIVDSTAILAAISNTLQCLSQQAVSSTSEPSRWVT